MCPIVPNVFLLLFFQTSLNLKQNKKPKQITNMIPVWYRRATDVLQPCYQRATNVLLYNNLMLLGENSIKQRATVISNKR